MLPPSYHKALESLRLASAASRLQHQQLGLGGISQSQMRQNGSDMASSMLSGMSNHSLGLQSSMGGASLSTIGMRLETDVQRELLQMRLLQMGMPMNGSQERTGMYGGNLLSQERAENQNEISTMMRLSMGAPEDRMGRYAENFLSQGRSPHQNQAKQLPVPFLSKAKDSKETLFGLFPCVHLRGLPFDCTLEDIAMFFQGLDILDVVLPEQQGHASDRAWVLFSSASDIPAALARDRQYIGRRYIEVFQSARREFYKAAYELQMQGESAADAQSSSSSRKRSKRDDGKTGENEDNPVEALANTTTSLRRLPPEQSRGVVATEGQGVIRMRGIPFTATRADILEFFEGYNVIADSVVFGTSSGRMTGEALVGFQSESDASAAMEKNRETIGTRYVELFMSSPEEMARFAGQNTTARKNK